MRGFVIIALLHTNDLHSHLDVWPYTAAQVASERALAESQGTPVLYLDAGDQLDLSERTCYGTTGQVNMDLLANLGCAAFTPGNNETLRLSYEQFTGLASRSKFPWLAANIRDLAGQPLPGLRDWALFDVGPVRVGVVGVTTPFPHLTRAMGIDHLDPQPAIAAAAQAVRAAGATIVILLSHLGLEADEAVAAAGLGVDLIVGGHTHHALHVPRLQAGGAVVTQAGCYGHYVGSLKLTVDVERGALVGVGGGLVPVTAGGQAAQAAGKERAEADTSPLVPADRTAARIIAAATSRADQLLAEVLATLPAPLAHSVTGASDVAPLVAESLRRYWQAEIGLVVHGLIQAGFAAGPLTHEAVLSALPGLLIPARLTLTGATLQALLEQSEDPACHGTVLWGSGFRPPSTPVGRIGVAGVTYDLDPHAPLGQRVTNVHVQGEPLEPARSYSAGAVSTLRHPDCGYPACADIRLVDRAMPTLAREVFVQALRQA